MIVPFSSLAKKLQPPRPYPPYYGEHRPRKLQWLAHLFFHEEVCHWVFGFCGTARDAKKLLAGAEKSFFYSLPAVKDRSDAAIATTLVAAFPSVLWMQASYMSPLIGDTEVAIWRPCQSIDWANFSLNRERHLIYHYAARALEETVIIEWVEAKTRYWVKRGEE